MSRAKGEKKKWHSAKREDRIERERETATSGLTCDWFAHRLVFFTQFRSIWYGNQAPDLRPVHFLYTGISFNPLSLVFLNIPADVHPWRLSTRVLSSSSTSSSSSSSFFSSSSSSSSSFSWCSCYYWRMVMLMLMLLQLQLHPALTNASAHSHSLFYSW